MEASLLDVQFENAATDGRFLIFANMDVSKRITSAGCALPVSGYDTTADYGMGLVPIFYLWILYA